MVDVAKFKVYYVYLRNETPQKTEPRPSHEEQVSEGLTKSIDSRDQEINFEPEAPAIDIEH